MENVMINEMSFNRFKMKNMRDRLYSEMYNIIEHCGEGEQECSYGLYENISMCYCTPIELSYELMWEE